MRSPLLFGSAVMALAVFVRWVLQLRWLHTGRWPHLVVHGSDGIARTVPMNVTLFWQTLGVGAVAFVVKLVRLVRR